MKQVFRYEGVCRRGEYVSPDLNTSLSPAGPVTSIDYFIRSINTNGAIKARDPSRGRVSGQRGPRSKCARSAKTRGEPRMRNNRRAPNKADPVLQYKLWWN